MKRTLIFHPFLLAIFPVLALYSHNVSVVSADQIFVPAAISLSAVTIMFALLKLVFRDAMKIAIFLSLFLLLFFSFGHLYDGLENVFGDIEIGSLKFDDAIYAVIFISETAILALTAYFLIKTKRNLEGATAFLNIVSVVLLVTPLANVTSHILLSHSPGVKARAPLPAATIVTGEDVSQYPNIYYIILDACARQDILNDVYNYDNSEFIDYLTDKGFYVAEDSQSNYSNTHESLASSLNLNYLNDSIKTAQETKRAERNNLVSGFLKDKGYDVETIFATPDNITGADGNRFLIRGFTVDEFSNMLMNTTPLPVLLKYCKIYDPFDLYRRKMNYYFGYLSDSCSRKGPFFIFIHIGAPHPPFVFGSNGESVSAINTFTANDGFRLVRKGRLTEDEYRKYYVGQLTYISKRIRDVVDSILSRSDKPPIIVIQADHGPRSMLKSWDSVDAGNLDEEFSILNAYYLPGKNNTQLYSSISPVNTFRVIFNCYFGEHYALLEDRSYFAPPVKTIYNFVDITDRLKKQKAKIPLAGRIF